MKKTFVLLGLLLSMTLSAQTETVSKWEKVLAKLPDISGFINLRYQYDGADESNSFDVRRARLDFKGDIYKNVDYRLLLEFAGTPKVLDAYVRWKVDRRFNLQAGAFKIPFSLENITGPTNLETIDNSMSISKLCNYSDLSGLSANGRDVGLSIYGAFFGRDGFDILEYAVGVFNGNGINTRDNNKQKDFSGRININPLKTLTLSGSYYYGYYKNSAANLKRQRTAGGLRWDNKKLLVRSEYLWGQTGDIRSEGVYAVVACFVHPKVQPLLKYDYFQSDKSSRSTREHDYTAGLNYIPCKNIRLQANYTFRQKKNGDNSNYVALQVFAMF